VERWSNLVKRFGFWKLVIGLAVVILGPILHGFYTLVIRVQELHRKKRAEAQAWKVEEAQGLLYGDEGSEEVDINDTTLEKEESTEVEAEKPLPPVPAKTEEPGSLEV